MCRGPIRRMEFLALAELTLKENTLHMGEALKACFAVIGSHAGGTYTAKGNIFLNNMPGSVVNCHAARNALI